jgi:hypothetical protein
VVKLIAEGHTSKEIAASLVLSVKTVERHRANILGKLGMRDRVDLTRYAIRCRAGRTVENPASTTRCARSEQRFVRPRGVQDCARGANSRSSCAPIWLL